MKRMLDEFYYGNVVPDSHGVKRGSEYDRAMRAIVKYEDELTAKLNDAGKDVLKAHEDAHACLLSVTARELWKQGFSLGLRIGMEVMDDAGYDLASITEEE